MNLTLHPKCGHAVQVYDHGNLTKDLPCAGETTALRAHHELQINILNQADPLKPRLEVVSFARRFVRSAPWTDGSDGQTMVTQAPTWWVYAVPYGVPRMPPEHLQFDFKVEELLRAQPHDVERFLRSCTQDRCDLMVLALSIRGSLRVRREG